MPAPWLKGCAAGGSACQLAVVHDFDFSIELLRAYIESTSDGLHHGLYVAGRPPPLYADWSVQMYMLPYVYVPHCVLQLRRRV